MKNTGRSDYMRYEIKGGMMPGRNHFGGRGIYKLRKRCNGMDVSEYADADIRWRSRQDVHQGHIR